MLGTGFPRKSHMLRGWSWELRASTCSIVLTSIHTHYSFDIMCNHTNHNSATVSSYRYISHLVPVRHIYTMHKDYASTNRGKPVLVHEPCGITEAFVRHSKGITFAVEELMSYILHTGSKAGS